MPQYKECWSLEDAHKVSANQTWTLIHGRVQNRTNGQINSAEITIIKELLKYNLH
jgi:hypothetical protein